jgi:hypothetical protein
VKLGGTLNSKFLRDFFWQSGWKVCVFGYIGLAGFLGAKALVPVSCFLFLLQASDQAFQEERRKRM